MRQRIEESPTGCWLWKGSVNWAGYGLHGSGHNRQRRGAHRAVYEAIKGPIPEGLTLDHLCRVRNCVNPQHLEPVTIKENIRRAPRVTSGLCKRGHPLDGWQSSKSPKRLCRQCAREKTRAFKAANKERMAARRKELYDANIAERRLYNRMWKLMARRKAQQEASSA